MYSVQRNRHLYLAKFHSGRCLLFATQRPIKDRRAQKECVIAILTHIKACRMWEYPVKQALRQDKYARFHVWHRAVTPINNAQRQYFIRQNLFYNSMLQNVPEAIQDTDGSFHIKIR